jgi:hypothetical protein
MENQYEITKNMLKTIREVQSNGKKLLKENSNNEQDSIQLSGEELNQEQSKFRDVITSRVEFTSFNIYPQAGNVVFGGKFQDMDNMEWQFSLEETDGLYITSNNMQVSDDVVNRIQKLKGYYDNWASEWSNKLATEYKSNSNSNV